MNLLKDMKYQRIQVPGSSTSVLTPAGQAEETQRMVNARHAFVQRYCAEKGWPNDAGSLSIEQILEIRSQPGWKDP